MNDITCPICQDLIPLVADAIASPDSRAAVEQHIRSCPACAALYSGAPAPAPNADPAIRRALGHLRSLGISALIFGIFFGLGLTAGSGVFYNVILMPILGGLGYMIFRWRAAWIVPLALFAVHVLINLLGIGNELLSIPSLLLWTAIYAAISLVGVLIAGLLHFVFKKET